MAKQPDLPAAYPALLQDLKERIRSARLKASLAVNCELVMLYWSIGRDIVEKQRVEHWGTNMVDRLSKDLSREFPDYKGFSRRNVLYMRLFAESYPNERFVQQAAAQIPWTHNCIILDKVKSRAQREWYIHQTIENGWSRNVLIFQIERCLYEHQGKALTNFSSTLPEPDSDLAQQLTKDSYTFDFLSVESKMRERQLERGLVDNILAFILELGKGFAFLGSQYHIEVGGEDYYIDLLFYHIKLRCFVVIDLKTGKFKPEFAGKMNFYLSAVDDMLRHPDDKRSIGIILCKINNSFAVEYALRDMTKPMGVAEYRVTQRLPDRLRQDLPTAEELTARLRSAPASPARPVSLPKPRRRTDT